jgi:hypothetical protein
VEAFMIQRLALILIPALIAGCVLRNVVALEPAGKKIKLVREADKPINCEPVASISGTSRAEKEKEARRGAENDMRNRAGQYDANFAVVETERTRQAGTGPYKEVFLGGKAMKCLTLEMEIEREKAEAEAKERQETEEAERARQEELERAKREAEEEEEKEKEKEKEKEENDK